ncbi:MAG: aminotransferase class I/II-fold pyridoxal phosphate-dependent enzyme [Chloroflexota bacterium]|nr:aminotransferase class I/II-fold pyridoxal phosphate-dependent enzyme [Chloroflexota bacterium]
MTWKPARRVREFKPTVFAEMSDLSARYGAVNLGQGFPDFPGPGFVKDAAIRAIDLDLNQYAHPHGVPALRQAIAEDWSARFGLEVDPDLHVTVTSGATEAIFDTILSMLDPHDELITFEPFYDSYPASVQMAGGTMRVVRLDLPGWTFSLDALNDAVSDRTRVILLNTPHNPTGKVFTRTELQSIADLAIERDLVVVTDEVYDRIVYDEAVHIPIATLPGMWERTLTINSTGKTFSMTGWKIGYAIGPDHLVAALRSVHQFVTFATSTPLQVAMAEAIPMAGENGYYDKLASDYRERRDTLHGMLEGVSLPAEPALGSYFLMASFAHLDFSSDVAFCRHLITQVGVTSIPPSAFYVDPETAPKMVRFCFAKQLSTLTDAGYRLGRSNLVGARSAAD